MTDNTDIWSDLRRPTPGWVSEAPLGIFIHWGPYSVPAWAEPSGALGTVPEAEWFAHNAYAEWYANTIAIPGSPAAEHHQQVYGNAPYDDFIDQWTAERFDPARWAELFARTGASYVIPTTKHHDGVALWDAPGTGTRNTVHRGPQRDLIGELATAVRAAGMRFGVYYSGGLDWHVTDFPPITNHHDVEGLRPNDEEYHRYALGHVRDLIARYAPDVLWNDINWPDAGKRTGPDSLHELLSDFYAGNPDGIVNDRWGDTHWDFRTSEYELGTEHEQYPGWEQCRGIGFSFGYNQAEDESVILSGPELARLLGDIRSRGGRLLLNVGPTAAGELPPVQVKSLEGLGAWMADVGDVLRNCASVHSELAQSSNDPWVRWLMTRDHLVALVDESGSTRLRFRTDGWDTDQARVLGAGRVSSHAGGVVVDLDPGRPGPAAVLIPHA